MNIQEILTTELETLRREIIEKHEKAGQPATGKTKASFSIENISEEKGELQGANYSGVLERGRRAGKIPYDFIDILKRWATAKGITFSNEKDFNRWAWFVSQKIKREGTLLYRSGQREDIFETPIKDFETRLGNKISSFYQTQIANEIFNF